MAAPEDVVISSSLEGTYMSGRHSAMEVVG